MFVVLSTLGEEKEIQPSTAVFGEPTNLTCPLVRGDTNFAIFWKINNLTVFCDACNATTCDIECSNSFNASILQIENTSRLGVGSHQVECILQPNIHPNYTSDATFLPQFQDNVTKRAMLLIYNTTSIGNPIYFIIAIPLVNFPLVHLYFCRSVL